MVLGVLRWAFCGRRRLRSASVNPENDLERSKAEDRVATTTTEIGSLGMLLAKPGIGLVLLGGMLVAMEYLADVYLVHEVSSRSVMWWRLQTAATSSTGRPVGDTLPGCFRRCRD